ncbi:phage tail protein [Hymenobacter ruricola]|uniref:Phage tail protein n=1 Tax=Hymenobacter ruricola TaxID=2791023 RepID=A0ABS0I3K5_9BACT|nr:tail fiber protein [Hymenobacter ruricola]MBF9221177.1 phage tail protein [Hymenobacter ruricola]
MEPLLGEIRAVAFSFAPRGWAICDGSLIQIRSNTALFSILGTQYGGNGTTTFALPDLRGRVIVDAGAGAGLTSYTPGEMTGIESVTLQQPEMPAHTHTLSASVNVNSQPGNAASPSGNYLSDTVDPQYGATASTKTMAAGSVKGSGGIVGGNQPHENRQPFLAMYYVIALQGVFPQRS